MDKEDVFRDLARLHLSHRDGINAGQILKLSANGKSVLLVARGAPGNKKDHIWLDLETRDQLGVKLNETCEFTVSKATIVGQILWAWRSTEPANRIASRLGVLSFALGVLGVVLAVWSIYLAI